MYVHMQAHSNVKIEDLFGSGPISKQLALEVDLEVRTILTDTLIHTSLLFVLSMDYSESLTFT